ncbi:hypothetical protein B0H17DRAFT_427014 [Mycena rosella]|uniref:Uncharacterized protein n=1 Tax=Mycena rosella TaxID=1033263 RepID=A0AAD7DN66_MYCRO|nr:hypothetical protein B0H17DRAFT_427014 [Mycena rosella]
MRGIPQPPNEPRVEGCPIVKVSDSIQDVEHLLRSLYDPLFNSAKQLEFAVVAALVRLGKKYNFNQLLTATVARLTAQFPQTLRGSIAYKPSYTIAESPGLLFDAINLATENGLLTLLPWLYFNVLLVYQYDQECILTGIQRNNGTVAKLTLATQIVLAKSRRNVLRTQAALLFDWLAPEHLSSPTCASRVECITLRDSSTCGFFVPIYHLKTMRWDSTFERGFCAHCRAVMTIKFDEGSQKCCPRSLAFLSGRISRTMFKSIPQRRVGFFPRSRSPIPIFDTTGVYT